MEVSSEIFLEGLRPALAFGFGIQVFLFQSAALVGQFSLDLPGWIAGIFFPGYALFWAQGIHSDHVIAGFIGGTLLDIVVYAAVFWVMRLALRKQI